MNCQPFLRHWRQREGWRREGQREEKYRKGRSKRSVLWGFWEGLRDGLCLTLCQVVVSFHHFHFNFPCLIFTSRLPLHTVKTDKTWVVFPLCRHCVSRQLDYRRLLLMSFPNLYPIHSETLLPYDRDSGVDCWAFICDVQSLSVLWWWCPELRRKRFHLSKRSPSSCHCCPPQVTVIRRASKEGCWVSTVCFRGCFKIKQAVIEN